MICHTGRVPPTTGVRQRQRAETLARLKQVARTHLAEHGAAALSLRAIARDLGVVSSAVYRYVASRDELLTLLIVDAYDSLGAAAEHAASQVAGRSPAERWTAIAHAIRAWALANPHEYALVYGSPVPGYAAPEDTIAPAGRVVNALLRPVADAHAAVPLAEPAVPLHRGDGELAPTLRAELVAIAAQLDVDLPPEVLARAMVAWTQLFGLVSFELFGQTRNAITDHAALLDAACAAMTALIGL